MRSFSAVLLRRILFRPLPTSSVSASSGSSTIYDHISEPTRNNIEKALLHCLKEESDESVRKKVVDTITDVALGSLERGRTSYCANSIILLFSVHLSAPQDHGPSSSRPLSNARSPQRRAIENRPFGFLPPSRISS
jgi:hypothetical protein